MAFCFDLRLSTLGYPVRLRLSVGLHFLKNLSSLRTGLISDAGSFCTSVRQECVVFLQRFLSFGLGILCLGNSTLDSLGALIQCLLQSGQHHAPEQQQHQSKRNDRPDNVIDRGEQRVRCFPFRCEKECFGLHSQAYPVKMKYVAIPMNASASVKAIPIYIKTVRRP